MRFRAAVAVGDVLDVCRPFLAGALPPALRSSLPPFLGSLEPPDFSGPDSLTLLSARTPLVVRRSLQAALVLAQIGDGSAYGRPVGDGSTYGRPGSDGPGSGASTLVPPATTRPPGMPEEEPGAEPPDSQAPDSAGPANLPGFPPVIEVKDLHAVLAALLHAFSDRFVRAEPFKAGEGNLVSSTAVVDGVLEGGVTVGAGAVIGRGAYIGSGSRIGPNAVIEAHCYLGRNCEVQAGAVIGSAGFGFFPGGSGGVEPMPHPAGVEIGEGCRVGSNSVVAAGVLSPTVLGRGCQVDSLVQIAHNVRIGEGALIASQCGIAGSTVVGKRFRMGGAAGLGDHLRLGDDVTVAAYSGVTKNLPDGATVAGFPALPIRDWRRREIRLKSES